jgi:hypothetical protein
MKELANATWFAARRFTQWLDEIGERNAERTRAWFHRRYGDREWWND